VEAAEALEGLCAVYGRKWDDTVGGMSAAMYGGK